MRVYFIICGKLRSWFILLWWTQEGILYSCKLRSWYTLLWWTQELVYSGKLRSWYTLVNSEARILWQTQELVYFTLVNSGVYVFNLWWTQEGILDFNKIVSMCIYFLWYLSAEKFTKQFSFHLLFTTGMLNFVLWFRDVAVRLTRKFSKSPCFQIHLYYNRLTIDYVE